MILSICKEDEKITHMDFPEIPEGWHLTGEARETRKGEAAIVIERDGFEVVTNADINCPIEGFILARNIKKIKFGRAYEFELLLEVDAPELNDWMLVAHNRVIKRGEGYVLDHGKEVDVRIAQGFRFSHEGGGCPIPDGVAYTAKLRNGERVSSSDDDAHSLIWTSGESPDAMSEVIFFTVDGVIDGYEY